MAKKNRYRALEKLMTEVLLGDALVFILFLIFSSKDVPPFIVATHNPVAYGGLNVKLLEFVEQMIDYG